MQSKIIFCAQKNLKACFTTCTFSDVKISLRWSDNLRQRSHTKEIFTRSSWYTIFDNLRELQGSKIIWGNSSKILNWHLYCLREHINTHYVQHLSLERTFSWNIKCCVWHWFCRSQGKKLWESCRNQLNIRIFFKKHWSVIICENCFLNYQILCSRQSKRILTSSPPMHFGQ